MCRFRLHLTKEEKYAILGVQSRSGIYEDLANYGIFLEEEEYGKRNWRTEPNRIDYED